MSASFSQSLQREERVEVDVYLHPSFCEGLTLIAYRDGAEITCSKELRQIKQQVKEALAQLVIPPVTSGKLDRVLVRNQRSAHVGDIGWGVETVAPISEIPLMALAERIRSYLQLQMLTNPPETLKAMEHMVGWTVETPEGLLIRLHLPTS